MKQKIAIVMASLAVAGGVSVASPGAEAVAACAKKVSGSPGSSSFTLKIANTCAPLRARAVLGYENFYGTFLTDYGPWKVSGSSKAETSSSITDTIVCWGYQKDYTVQGKVYQSGTYWLGGSRC